MGQRLFIYVAVAISLGVISPEIARVFDLTVTHDHSGLFYWWFIGAPAAVDRLVGVGDDMRLVLWSATFSVMYLCLFAAVSVAMGAVQTFLHRNDDRSKAFDAAATQFTQHDW
ncbi:hypothetical protein [Caenimonas koreensis]|uniref:hypothetical protein n=1 Tax=Caenimonas koreensis TaxID=367474 RepID=UPI003783A57C